MADDYNFIANQYNVSRAITKRLASRNLPEEYIRYMTNYYAKMIVRDGVTNMSTRVMPLQFMAR